MSIVATLPESAKAPLGDHVVPGVVEELRGWFDAQCSVFDGATGQLICQGADAPRDRAQTFEELVRAVSDRSTCEFLADEDPVLVFAFPFQRHKDHPLVAAAAFVTRPVDDTEDLSAAARLLGRSERDTKDWIDRQTVWPAAALLRLGDALLAKWAGDARIEDLQHEVDKVSDNLSSTYEEISLLYGLTQNLRISASEEELGHLALDWLLEVVPAEGVAIHNAHRRNADDRSGEGQNSATLLTAGACPIDGDVFQRLIESLDPDARHRPLVANVNVTGQDSWQFPQIREVIATPLVEGENVFGWLAAFNHTENAEFGTVEASLLGSVGAILGIHSGNTELYRQQAGLTTGVVQALTSAIDAKDPYTCGHSDRVARIAVRLAQELDYDAEDLQTVYMAGLLHDIGKIGIDDNVLRKPGRLNDAEFQHIKLHPGLGHKILKDLAHLADVLPTVLHHHEQWDGSGYPSRLAGEDIPLTARICAVADAYDAMTSDRPYRQGMPVEKVEAIFRNGSGSQWDARVIDAYFDVKEDILEVCRRERASLDLNVQQWT